MKLITRGRGKLVFLMLSSVAVVALAACTGDSGSQGIQGPAGPAGFAGNPGSAGLAGAPGNPGEPGLSGAPGNAGSPGIPGADGTDGTDGANGVDGKDAGENPSSVVVVDAATGSAGYVEFKAVGTTQANVVGGGFFGNETVTLHAGPTVLGSAKANASGAFEATVDLTDVSFGAGSIHTLNATGDVSSIAVAGFVIIDKVATD